MKSHGRVLIVTGPAGAGKTTAAKLLAEQTAPGVHLEADRFFHFIVSGYIAPWKPESHDQNTIVMRTVASAAASYADGGYATIIDGIVSPRWFLPPLHEHLRRCGHTVAYAVLRPSLETCQARASRRSTDRLADPEVLQQLWREFASLGDLERHVIETEGQSVEETADALTRGIGQELLLEQAPPRPRPPH